MCLVRRFPERPVHSLLLSEGGWSQSFLYTSSEFQPLAHKSDQNHHRTLLLFHGAHFVHLSRLGLPTYYTSINSSGVHIIGVGIPKPSFIFVNIFLTLALAICLQFHDIK